MADTAAPERSEEAAPPRRRRPLFVLWAVVAALAVGAGAIVVAAGDDDPPRLPVALGAGDARAEAGAADATMSMAAWVRYAAGDGLPDLGGNAPAHRLANDVDPARLQEVADALGLDGEVVEQPGGEGSWQVESGDGSLLGAGPYGGGSWWYTSGALLRGEQGGGASGSSSSSASTEEQVRKREAAAATEERPVSGCAPDTPCAEPTPAIPTEPPVPAADLPSKAEAEEAALDLFRRLGVEVDGARVTTEGPVDAWYVSVEPLVDGLVVSGYVFHAAVGPRGAIATAGGVLNRPEGLGEYPTVDTRAAIDRLNEQSSGFGDGREPGVAADASSTGASSAGASSGAADCVEPDGIEPACAPATPAEPAEPAAAAEVVLHDAERILMLVPAVEAADESYLVPGYRFRSDEVGWVDVIAVDDDSLVPPPPVPVEPVPGGRPEPGGDPGAVDGAPGCAPVEPGPDGAVPDICLDPGSVATTEPRASVEPSGPVSDPDPPVQSPPVGER